MKQFKAFLFVAFLMEHANGQGAKQTWLSITPTGAAPAVRYLHSSAYDSVTNTLMIFGGSNCQSDYYNDIWILKNANASTSTPAWTQLAPTGTAPTARESSSAVYDPTSNTLNVFGGDSGPDQQLGDIWLLAHANGTGGTPAWSQMIPSNNGPTARSGQSATYDPTTNRMTVYGGYNGDHVLTDVWVLEGANGKSGAASWVQSLTGQPRRFHVSIYDASPDDMITFGGQTNASPLNPTSDIWVLTNANLE